MRGYRGILKIRPSFWVLICAASYFGSGSLLAVFLLGGAVHEAGHILAAGCMGRRVDTLTLSGLGGELTLEGGGTSFRQDLALSLSGPLANLLLALVLSALGRAPLLLGVNLLLGGFNLLPIFPLDGGCALYALLALAASPSVALGATCLLARLLSLALLGAGGWLLLLPGGRPWLLALGGYLTAAAFSDLPGRRG